MWTYNDRTKQGTKHFRGLSTDSELTDDEAFKLSNEHLRNGDECFFIDTSEVKIYDGSNKTWITI